MDLVVENGTSNPNAKAFATLGQYRKYANGRWGWEGHGDDGDCDDARVESALRAAAEYMDTIPWVGVRTSVDQALCWPRILLPPADYNRSSRYGRLTYGWASRRHATNRNLVSSNVVPDKIVESNILLAKDILDGLLDPTGRLKPAVVTSVSTPAGSLNFARPQAVNNAANLQVRSRDPLYAVRRLIAPWMQTRVPNMRLTR